MTDDYENEGGETVSEEKREIVKLAKKRWKESVEKDTLNRLNYPQAIKFYNGEGFYPDAIRKERELAGRPLVVVNKGRAMVRVVINSFRQNPVASKVTPSGGGSDPATAEVLTGIIRNIEAQSDAKSVYENAAFCSVTGGFGYARVVTDYIEGTFEQDAYIRPIYNPLTVVRDWKGMALDGSDWEYVFVTDKISLEEAKERYKVDVTSWDMNDVEWYDGEYVNIAEYFYFEESDEELHLLSDGSVMTATEYKESGSKKTIEDTRTIKDKKVKWCLLAGNSEVPLEEKEWPSKYLPIVPFYGDVTVIDGKLVLQELLYHAKDSLRMLSYFRSTEIELLALTPKAPYVGTQAQFENHPEWDDANTVAYSKLTYTPDPQAAGAPQRQGFASPPTGVLQGAVNSQNDMNDILNIHEASLGQQGNETSGKAINARQRQGDTSTYNFPNNWAKSVSQITKILVDLIPKIYDTPRVVRILGEDGSEKMTPVNKKFIETKNGEKVQSIYNLGVGTYDVVSSVGPSYQTRRQEEAEVLQAMLQGNPALMQTHGDIIAETLDFPGSEKFAARTRRMIPKELLDAEEGEAPQLPPEVTQQIEQMGAQIEQMNQAGQALHQQLLAAEDKLQLEQMKIQVDQFNAETARMKAEGELALKAQSQRPNADSLTDTLTEAEKIQHDTELQIRMQEMKEDHEKEMAVLNARLDRLKSSASIMVDIDDDGNEVDSAYVVAINELQGQLEQQSAAFSDVINRMTQPEEIVRDDEGNIIGAKTGIGFKKIVRDEKGNPIGVEIV